MAIGTRERITLAALAAAIAALHVIGWLALTASSGVAIGIGLTAYALGLRHAIDPDHIAAIDNLTRKLTGAGKRSHSVGFWFSLGHSTIVFGVSLLIAFGVRSLLSEGPWMRYGGLIGTAVSGTFLCVIAAANVRALAAIRSEADPDLSRRGLLSRLFYPVAARVNRPGAAYGLGLLFGLGFDTASEVSLLTLSASSGSLTWWGILSLPIVFAAGMSLLDTLDGSVMTFAYRWTLDRPERRRNYNLSVTGLSVIVAASVGAAELASLL
jgi:high-affinity nickel-transport protein